MLPAFDMRSIIVEWEVEEWWDKPCEHMTVQLVESCLPALIIYNLQWYAARWKIAAVLPSM
jgi:hypothetical protein